MLLNAIQSYVYVLPCIITCSFFKKVLGITPREAAIASKVLQRMSFILSDAHDSTYEGDNGLGSSLYCTPERMSSFRTEIESSPLISKVFAFSTMPVSSPKSSSSFSAMKRVFNTILIKSSYFYN